MKTFGRKTILANYTEKDFLTGDVESKIIEIINDSIDTHLENKKESKYLQDYLYGDQDIKDKKKYTRTEINNKSVENWAWAFQEWKKG